MKKIKNIFIALLLVLGFAGYGAVLTPNAAADNTDSICEGVEFTGGTCTEDPDDPNNAQSRVNNIIATVINIFSILVGVAAVIMIIIGGFRYITSGGDSNNINGAKNTILYAIIGLVVVAMAQVIVAFVITRI